MLKAIYKNQKSIVLKKSLSKYVGCSSVSFMRFSSSFNSLNFSEVIREILNRRNIPFNENEKLFTVQFCPTCPPHKEQPNNMFKLVVFKNGGFYCHRCLNKGNFTKFTQMMNSSRYKNFMSDEFDIDNKQKNVSRKQVTEKYQETLQKHLEEARAALEDQSKGYAERILATRGLSLETLRAYNVGMREFTYTLDDDVKSLELSILYPWYVSDKDGHKFCRIKARSLETKAHQLIFPKGGEWGLFGYNLIEPSDEVVVITEGEYDAMAVYQKTKMKALSLPNGCNNLPLDLLPLLEQFKKIYLWMDNDMNGKEAAEKFSRKLGLGRCFVVKSKSDENEPLIKDANEALQAGKDMNKMIEEAKLIPHKQISSIENLKEDILHELNSPDEKRGTQLMTLPCLNNILKGHRSGELTILTGQTGIGKTTFLSQLSLDLAIQGINTLWGSFEIKTPRLGKVMLNQFSGKNLENEMDKFEYFFNAFDTLPMNFMRFFGTTDLDEVLDAMEYANHVYDVKHIVLDNLQFMLGYTQSINRFDQLDHAISCLRQFATNRNVHITVVIHPRKEQEGRELGISSIFGSAKATQEADNVIVLDNTSNSKSIHIKKNRFSGNVGSVEFEFDKTTRLFSTKNSFTDLGKPIGIYNTFKKKANNEIMMKLFEPDTENKNGETQNKNDKPAENEKEWVKVIDQ